MPRDGLGNYAPPAGTNGVPNFTIESAKYNGFVADIALDQNNPRPITSGGTGAINAHDAMVNLSGEIANQVVTNYDTFPFVGGSFSSIPGATGAPPATTTGFFIGIAYLYDNGNKFLEAREIVVGGVPGLHYVRHMQGGVWGAWALQPGSTADLDARYVNVGGDTMTGQLSVWNAITINAPTKTAAAASGLQWSTDPADAPSTFQSWIYQRSGPAAADKRLAIQSLENGVAWRPITLGEEGSSIVAIGTATPTPTWRVHVKIGANQNVGFLTFDGTNCGMQIMNDAGNALVPFRIQSSTLQLDGVITAAAKGHQFGGASGTVATAPVAITDANILLYSAPPNNWAGIGADGNGHMWFRVGNSGTPLPALWFNATDFSANFNGLLNVNGDARIMRSGFPTSGYLNLGNGNTYLGFNGTSFVTGAFSFISSSTGSSSAANAQFRVGCIGASTQYGITIRPQQDNTAAVLLVNAADVGIGQIAVSPTATSYVTTSARELKEDLRSFDAGRIVDNTNVYDFKWRSTGERAYGVVAQEANEVYPTAVVNSKIKKTITAEGKADEEVVEDFWGVDYSKYVPVILQELKALRERVRELEGGIVAKPA